MSSVKACIQQRHSVRSFTSQPISETEILELLEAARQAPSSLNSQPWRFAVITDAATREWIASKEVSRQQADHPHIRAKTESVFQLLLVKHAHPAGSQPHLRGA